LAKNFYALEEEVVGGVGTTMRKSQMLMQYHFTELWAD
jgi:hypothetical protein